MILVFLVELLVLFFLSQMLTKELSLFFYKLFKSQKISSYLMALIFLPGTVIHELAHATMAKALLVPVGKIDLMPKIYGESLKLGSVEVGRSDVFRDFFIGVAPFFAGGFFLLLILSYSFSNSILGLNLVTALTIYATFVISNTMYASKKDMEGAIEFIATILIIVGAVFFSGVQINFDFAAKFLESEFVMYAVYLMLAPIVVNIGVIAFAKILNR